MSQILGLIGIAGVIVISVILFRVLKGASKTVFSVFISVVIFGGMIWVGLDILDLQRNFAEREKLVVLDDNRTLAAGFILREDEISQVSEFHGEMYPEMLGQLSTEYYKIIIFKKEIFEDREISEEEFPHIIQEMSSEEMISNMRKGTIKVFPETVTFKLMRFIPLDWLVKLIKPKVEVGEKRLENGNF